MVRRHKQTFLQRRHTDGQQTHEKMLHTVHYLRNANQNYMRCHDISVRMAIIKKSTINAGEDVKKREPSCIVGGNVNWYNHHGKQYGDSFKKLGIKPPCDQAIPLLGLHPEKITNWKRHVHPNVHGSMIYNSQNTEAKMSTERWMDKEAVAHTHNGILISHKKEQIWVSSSDVDKPRACHKE